MVLVIVCVLNTKTFKTKQKFILVTVPASVIGIGGDHSNLSNEKDQYDHVMSPFHRKYLFFFSQIDFLINSFF